MPPNKLEQLRCITTVVADTGDFRLLQALKPQDCTTNPSLVLKAAMLPDFSGLVDDVIRISADMMDTQQRIDRVAEELAVAIGCQALQLIPGRISTEVDAALSFDTEKMVSAAHRLIACYQRAGVSSERVLIKLAATWEGIAACRILEREGIQTNLTLVFSLVQAVAAAQAGAWLISPFVGRILDWHQKHNHKTYAAHEDPGVLSVNMIYHYFKQHQYQTIVMAASFRNQGEIEALAGCDRMTISPALLMALEQDHSPLGLGITASRESVLPMSIIDEANFRWGMNEDAMATDKLAEGIRLFNQDTQHLKSFIGQKIENL